MATAASPASAAFIVPLTSPCASAEVAPKFEKSTLDTERFIARAMSSVSSVPALPTTRPAIISAGLFST